VNKFELLKKEFVNSLSQQKKELLSKLCFYSNCICDFLFRNENLLDYFYENLEKPLLGRENLIKEALNLLEIEDENEFIQKITFFKMKHFGRIVSKDIYSKNPLTELMEEYSYLADATLEVAFQKAWQLTQKRMGLPLDENKNPVEASVIGLGKLGGTELNYYSDIDIMYIYDSEGKTDKGFTNREFFTSMFSKMTQMLTKRNIEGQTWIVDLDLRPNGKSGFIAYSLPALEVYYWTTGRTWERHMLLKARHSAGSQKTTEEFLKIIKPFVYRKSIAKDELEEIINMKELIQEEAEKAKSDEFDVKKGKGGIREIEFAVQILQLLYGGKIPELQTRSTYKAILKLKEKNILKENEANLLSEAYIFYRKLEHTVQIKNCIQTQSFKFKDAKEIALKLGFESENEFLKKIEEYRNKVESVFKSLNFGEETKELSIIQKYIFTKHYEDEVLKFLADVGFKDPKWALERIKEIYFSREFILLSEDFKQACFDFIPYLEETLKEFKDKEDFLRNFNKLLIEGKMLPIFASALIQNNKLVDFILNVAKISDYLTELMSKDPQLLDYAFGVEDVPSNKEEFEKELENVKKDDYIEKLNKFKNIVQVLSSLKYLTQIENKNSKERLKNLNETLSNLADFIIEKLYKREEVSGLVIYGLGKLGSREMNVGSDLDLVFAFKDSDLKLKYGNVPVNIVKSLTKYTKEGILYQIDLRLRPYGKAGELAPTLNFYKNYFQKEARSWERLAWTKARFITGDESVKKEMEHLIEEFLFSKPVDKEFLYDAYEMRMKLEGITSETIDEIDIKLGYGGLADIEFLSQIMILKKKINSTNIMDIVENYFPKIFESYLFLREVETRLRMIKGTGISKISKKSPNFYRIAHSFNMETDEMWDKILKERKLIRDEFIKNIKRI
jgi:glutamate-ammonia-ligase adenylyltransferase